MSRSIKGGDKLDAALSAIEDRLSKSPLLRVGILETAVYPDGRQVAEIGFYQEFGAPRARIPARPFMRPTIAAKSGEWGPALGKALVASDYDVTKALDKVGEAIEGQIRATVNAVTEPPLAPATIAAKGFDKPLIDTSDMWRSIAHDVAE